MQTLVVFIEAKAGRSAALRAALLAYTRETREGEPHCRQADVAEDPLDPSSFLVYLVFDDEAGWDAHQEGPHQQAFIAVAGQWIAARRVLPFVGISDHGQA